MFIERIVNINVHYESAGKCLPNEYLQQQQNNSDLWLEVSHVQMYLSHKFLVQLEKYWYIYNDNEPF